MAKILLIFALTFVPGINICLGVLLTDLDEPGKINIPNYEQTWKKLGVKDPEP
jgi:hypothetical protein